MHREYTAPNQKVGMDLTPAQPSNYAGSCSTLTSTEATKSDLPTKSCSSFRCASSPGKNVEPLIVFDWDDTVLASSWIQLRELIQTESNEDLPEDVRRELAVLEQSVVKCLANARGLGTVIIITNAEAGWVQLSAGKFFVNLLPLLEGVPVVSARSLFEGQFPGSPLCWKSAAFAYMMHDHFLDRSRWARKTVVSIGDSNEEKMALRIASGQHCSLAAKSVKFISSPDPEALSCQLDFVTQNLRTIVAATTDVEIVLEPSMVRKACSLTVHGREFDEDYRHEQPLGDTADLSDADDATISMTAASRPRDLESKCAEGNLPRAQSRALLQAQACGPPPVVSKARQQSLLGNETAASNSIPIPILTPGTGTCVSLGGGEGGGDCVQPFPAIQTTVVEGLESVESSAVAGSGGDVPSDGSGGACGGRTLPPDGKGCEEERPNTAGLKSHDNDASEGGGDAGIVLEAGVVGEEELGRAAIPSPSGRVEMMESSSESEEVAVVGGRGLEVGGGGEEGVFEFDDDVTGNPAPMA